MTERLTTDLSRISGSFVIAPNIAFAYKGKSFDVTKIGRELNVRYVLAGSVRRGDSRMPSPFDGPRSALSLCSPYASAFPSISTLYGALRQNQVAQRSERRKERARQSSGCRRGAANAPLSDRRGRRVRRQRPTGDMTLHPPRAGGVFQKGRPMLDRIDLQPPKRDSESYPTPTELALRVGFAMLLVLCVALLAQWVLPSRGG